MYTWNYFGDAEIWNNDLWETVEECIKDAKERLCEYSQEEQSSFNNIVYIGEIVKYVPTASWSDVLDKLNDQAYDQCGEIGGDWDFYNYKNKEELEELDRDLTQVLQNWLKKYKYYPNMYSVENIKEYKL